MFSSWLVLQVIYAIFAWMISIAIVAQASYRATISGKNLAKKIRELTVDQKKKVLPRLALLLNQPRVQDFFDVALESNSPDQLVEFLHRLVLLQKPPTRLLRALATAGTMLGLLACVGVLRDATGQPQAFQATIGLAFDSAVLGLVTAVPCWVGLAMAQRSYAQFAKESEILVLALTLAPERSDQ